MARKDFTTPYKLAETQSLAAAFSTQKTNVHLSDNVGILVETSGVTDNLGTFSVEVRMVPAEGKGSPSSWATLTLDSVPTLTNSDQSFLINLNQVSFTEIRVSFSAAGSIPDGTANIWVTSRQVGG